MSQSPPPRDRLLLAGTPNAVRLARLHTTDVLSRWGVHPDSIETIRLLVSELATNAIRHPKEGNQGDPSDAQRHTLQTFEIALESINGVVRVSVWDRDTTTPVVKQVSVEAASGRGLCIVAAMSRRWGATPHTGCLEKSCGRRCPFARRRTAVPRARPAVGGTPPQQRTPGLRARCPILPRGPARLPRSRHRPTPALRALPDVQLAASRHELMRLPA